jgi:hypothetical protein
MLSKRTVFILGAGASAAYGFSSGLGLLEAARALDLPRLVNNIGPIPRDNTDGPARELHGALTNSLAVSLDALLEQRPALEVAGKRLMAGMLLEQENAALRNRFASTDDWMRVLFAEMSRGAKTIGHFEDNPVTFVTFNYDRLLEHRLIHALCARYGCGLSTGVEVLGSVPIIHLHGDLGALPAQDTGGIPFGAIEADSVYDAQTLDIVRRSAERIRIVHTTSVDTIEFKAAHTALSKAEQIVLLGFGYGDTNLLRLNVNRWAESAPIVGTAKGLTEAEVFHMAMVRLRVRSTGTQHVRLCDLGCAQLLREFIGMFRIGLGTKDLERVP